MRFRLLLDENISPIVAEQVRAKAPQADIESIFGWRAGAFVGAPDGKLLPALHAEGRTLLTYDTQMLSEWSVLFTGDTPFSGVIFVDNRTIASDDFGGLVRAILALWRKEQAADWTGRLAYLRSASITE